MKNESTENSEQKIPPCMRRADREVSDDKWIRKFLTIAPLGIMATALESQPFVTHNTFYYDEDSNAIYMHTAKNGHLRSVIEKNPRVCFTVAEMGRLLPADTAREMSVEYSSVIVYGKASVLSDMRLAIDKMSRYIKKHFPHLESGKDYHPITEKEIREITVFRIEIESWTAKKKEAEPDFPGAFCFGSKS